ELLLLHVVLAQSEGVGLGRFRLCLVLFLVLFGGVALGPGLFFHGHLHRTGRLVQAVFLGVGVIDHVRVAGLGQGQLVEQLGDLGVLGVGLDRLFQLPAVLVLVLDKDDLLPALRQLDAAGVLGAEAGQAGVAQVGDRDEHFLELVGLDLEDLLVV